MTKSRLIKFVGISILAIMVTMVFYSQRIGFFTALDLKLKDGTF